MPEETNINPTPPVPEPSTPPPPPEPIVAPVAPAEPTPAPPVTTPEPIAPPVVSPPPTPAPAPQPPPDPLLSKGGGTDVRSLLAKAMAKIQFRKQAKLEKIMVLARQRGQVTNDDVQKLLRVSDATATRYLSELVKAGRLQRVGHPRHASYKPLP